MPKPTSLKLFTKTFTKRKNNNRNSNNKNDEELPPRPLTATLDKPTILNINLISQIDMSTIRKEFLNMSNLCHLPLTLTIKKRPKTTIISRPLSLPSTVPPQLANNCNYNSKVEKRPETGENNKNNNDMRFISKRRNKIKKTTDENGNNIDKKKTPIISDINDNNNNNQKTFRIPRKRIVSKLQITHNNDDNNNNNNNNNENIVRSSTVSIKLPEPCKTCGRPDQPERFHSHPATPLRPNRKQPEPPKMKSQVTKPVAIKYKSKQQPDQQNTGNVKKTLSTPKLLNTSRSLDKNPSNVVSSPKTVSTNRCKSGKRTLTCYICGREFGTASLPLHEPKCLQKWERENATLPSHLQRKPPMKPDCSSKDPNEWNENAWKASQANLVPCPNCGRTFYPDRLAVHQRSCKIVQNNNSKLSVQKLITTTAATAATVPSSPPTVECSICKRMFGKHSIKVHEKQCVKKSQLENDSSESVDNSNRIEMKSGKTARKPLLFPCYICGKLFTLSSIRIHEPQCLKKWQNENDKLPANKRQSPPIKPETMTRDGKIDLDALIEASWQSHLNQLVPCKYCSRTFNPDRVEIHERSCKGI